MIGGSGQHSHMRVRAARGPAAAFVVALLFTLQSYVTQTHIHLENPLPAWAGAQSYLQHPEARSHHGKRPVDDDPDHCPLCQAAVISGSFLKPVLPVLPPPVVHAGVLRIILQSGILAPAFTHAWQGRAPPGF